MTDQDSNAINGGAWILGSIAFGIWQKSLFAGLWFFCIVIVIVWIVCELKK